MTKRYRSMDFLRAVAILLVVLAHSILSYGAPAYLAPLQLGGTGVDLFFVLSGWLLGGLLFKEAVNNNKIDIKRFWARRWMRTLPAYYTVLILTVVQRYLTKENVEFPWEYFVFLQNYNTNIEIFFISWSLCVEEQFYLFIAPLLAFLTLLSRRSTTIILVTLFLFPFFFRQMDWYGHVMETHVRVDGCLAGVLLAHIRYQYNALWSKLVKLAPQIAFISMMLYLFFYLARYNPLWGISDPNKLFLAIMFASWVLLANANEHWSDKLYLPGANYIATRSYALYLLHPEILALLKRFFIEIPFPFYFIFALVGSLMLSEILYRVVEKPIMDARETYKFSKSSLKSS